MCPSAMAVLRARETVCGSVVEVVIELDDSKPAASLTNLQVDVLIHL